MKRALWLGLLGTLAIGTAQAATEKVAINLVSADGAPQAIGASQPSSSSTHSGTSRLAGPRRGPRRDVEVRLGNALVARREADDTRVHWVVGWMLARVRSNTLFLRPSRTLPIDAIRESHLSSVTLNSPFAKSTSKANCLRCW